MTPIEVLQTLLGDYPVDGSHAGVCSVTRKHSFRHSTPAESMHMLEDLTNALLVDPFEASTILYFSPGVLYALCDRCS